MPAEETEESPREDGAGEGASTGKLGSSVDDIVDGIVADKIVGDAVGIGCLGRRVRGVTEERDEEDERESDRSWTTGLDWPKSVRGIGSFGKMNDGHDSGFHLSRLERDVTRDDEARCVIGGADDTSNWGTVGVDGTTRNECGAPVWNSCEGPADDIGWPAPVWLICTRKVGSTFEDLAVDGGSNRDV